MRRTKKRDGYHKFRVAAIKRTLKKLGVNDHVIKKAVEDAVVANAVRVLEEIEAQLIEASEQAIEEIKKELEATCDAHVDNYIEKEVDRRLKKIKGKRNQTEPK